MIKLQDFARECTVTDRQIQRLLKKYENECKGHFERRGSNGTWLDDECQKILKSKMKDKAIVLNDTLKQFQNQIKELENKIERKDVIIERLQQREQDKDSLIENLKSEKLLIEEKKNSEITRIEDQLYLEKQNRERLEKELEEERHRKLSLKERLFGRKD